MTSPLFIIFGEKRKSVVAKTERERVEV